MGPQLPSRAAFRSGHVRPASQEEEEARPTQRHSDVSRETPAMRPAVTSTYRNAGLATGPCPPMFHVKHFVKAPPIEDRPNILVPHMTPCPRPDAPSAWT